MILPVMLRMLKLLDGEMKWRADRIPTDGWVRRLLLLFLLASPGRAAARRLRRVPCAWKRRGVAAVDLLGWFGLLNPLPGRALRGDLDDGETHGVQVTRAPAEVEVTPAGPVLPAVFVQVSPPCCSGGTSLMAAHPARLPWTGPAQPAQPRCFNHSAQPSTAAFTWSAWQASGEHQQPTGFVHPRSPAGPGRGAPPAVPRPP